MKLLYITYIDFDGKGKSGSSVRPQKMYKAFLDLGIDVKLLECQQNKFKERRKKVKEVLQWLDYNTPDICYIESPSGPIFNFIDLRLIRKIHEMRVPIGYFYRDMFWKFPERIRNVQFLKRVIINIMCRRDLAVIRGNCNIVYFPTVSAMNVFQDVNFKEQKTLPPAAEIIYSDTDCENNEKICIYVGGISDSYGSDILIDAFKVLNEKLCKYNLILICRKQEFEGYFKDGIFVEGIKIVNASGRELDKYYSVANVAVIPIRRDVYSDMAMSVKTFEYIGHGLPIITTNTKEMGGFVRNNEVGLVCEDNPESLAEAIKTFFADVDREKLYKNVQEVAKKNTWTSRAQQVIDDLTAIKNGKSKSI